jgi:hypothetical protein
MTLVTAFPGGATLNIVGPRHPAYVDVRVSNNVENGTSAARGSFPNAYPKGRDGSSAARDVRAGRPHHKPTHNSRILVVQASRLHKIAERPEGAQHSEFRIPNSEFDLG